MFHRRKRQKEEIQQLYQLLNGLQDTGICVINSAFQVLFFNAAASFFAGVTHCFEAYGKQQPCFDCPVRTPYQRQIICPENQTAIDSRAFALNWFGQSAFAVTIEPHCNESTNEKTLKRMNHAMQHAVDVYTEINAQTGTYHQINFAQSLFHVDNCGAYEDTFTHVVEEEIHPDDAARVRSLFSPEMLCAAAAQDDGPNEISIRYRLNTMHPPVWVESRAIFMRDEEPRYICMISKDVTAEMEREKEPLTGLLNRKAMEQNVNSFLKMASDEQNITFLSIDVDSFKSVNDMLGHEAGDRLLVEISVILCEQFRHSDLISRMGGDEFAVFVADSLPENAIRQKIEATTQAVSQIAPREHWNVPTEISMGFCTVNAKGKTFTDLYRAADGAMYHQKKAHHA